jgi:hypothetical protein
MYCSLYQNAECNGYTDLGSTDQPITMTEKYTAECTILFYSVYGIHSILTRVGDQVCVLIFLHIFEEEMAESTPRFPDSPSQRRVATWMGGHLNVSPADLGQLQIHSATLLSRRSSTIN